MSVGSTQSRASTMLTRRNRLLLGACFVGALTLAATARQGVPPRGLPCKAFAKNDQGDWVPKRDLTLRGPVGAVEIKAGAPILDELQEHLELRCH